MSEKPNSKGHDRKVKSPCPSGRSECNKTGVDREGDNKKVEEGITEGTFRKSRFIKNIEEADSKGPARKLRCITKSSIVESKDQQLDGDSVTKRTNSAKESGRHRKREDSKPRSASARKMVEDKMDNEVKMQQISECHSYESQDAKTTKNDGRKLCKAKRQISSMKHCIKVCKQYLENDNLPISPKSTEDSSEAGSTGLNTNLVKRCNKPCKQCNEKNDKPITPTLNKKRRPKSNESNGDRNTCSIKPCRLRMDKQDGLHMRSTMENNKEEKAKRNKKGVTKQMHSDFEDSAEVRESDRQESTSERKCQKRKRSAHLREEGGRTFIKRSRSKSPKTKPNANQPQAISRRSRKQSVTLKKRSASEPGGDDIYVDSAKPFNLYSLRNGELCYPSDSSLSPEMFALATETDTALHVYQFLAKGICKADDSPTMITEESIRFNRDSTNPRQTRKCVGPCAIDRLFEEHQNDAKVQEFAAFCDTIDGPDNLYNIIEIEKSEENDEIQKSNNKSCKSRTCKGICAKGKGPCISAKRNIEERVKCTAPCVLESVTEENLNIDEGCGAPCALKYPAKKELNSDDECKAPCALVVPVEDEECQASCASESLVEDVECQTSCAFEYLAEDVECQASCAVNFVTKDEECQASCAYESLAEDEECQASCAVESIAEDEECQASCALESPQENTAPIKCMVPCVLDKVKVEMIVEPVESICQAPCAATYPAVVENTRGTCVQECKAPCTTKFDKTGDKESFPVTEHSEGECRAPCAIKTVEVQTEDEECKGPCAYENHAEENVSSEKSCQAPCATESLKVDEIGVQTVEEECKAPCASEQIEKSHLELKEEKFVCKPSCKGMCAIKAVARDESVNSKCKAPCAAEHPATIKNRPEPNKRTVICNPSCRAPCAPVLEGFMKGCRAPCASEYDVEEKPDADKECMVPRTFDTVAEKSTNTDEECMASCAIESLEEENGDGECTGPCAFDSLAGKNVGTDEECIGPCASPPVANENLDTDKECIAPCAPAPVANENIETDEECMGPCAAAPVVIENLDTGEECMAPCASESPEVKIRATKRECKAPCAPTAVTGPIIDPVAAICRGRCAKTSEKTNSPIESVDIASEPPGTNEKKIRCRKCKCAARDGKVTDNQTIPRKKPERKTCGGPCATAKLIDGNPLFQKGADLANLVSKVLFCSETTGTSATTPSKRSTLDDRLIIGNDHDASSVDKPIVYGAKTQQTEIMKLSDVSLIANVGTPEWLEIIGRMAKSSKSCESTLKKTRKGTSIYQPIAFDAAQTRSIPCCKMVDWGNNTSSDIYDSRSGGRGGVQADGHIQAHQDVTDKSDKALQVCVPKTVGTVCPSMAYLPLNRHMLEQGNLAQFLISLGGKKSSDFNLWKMSDNCDLVRISIGIQTASDEDGLPHANRISVGKSSETEETDSIFLTERVTPNPETINEQMQTNKFSDLAAFLKEFLGIEVFSEDCIEVDSSDRWTPLMRENMSQCIVEDADLQTDID